MACIHQRAYNGGDQRPTCSGNTESERLTVYVLMATDSVLQRIPSAEIVILRDFNAH